MRFKSLIFTIKANKKFKALLLIGIIFLTILIIFLLTSKKQKTSVSPSPQSKFQELLKSSGITPFESQTANQYETISPTKEPEFLIAIDKTTSKLVKISPQSSTELFPDPISQYSYSPPLIVIIPAYQKKQIVLLNLDTGKTQTIALSSVAPLIDVAIAKDDTIFILAGLNARNRTTTLYSLPPNSQQPQPLYRGNATNIEVLSDQNILLFAYADALDASTISIFNLPSKTSLLETIANLYTISPSKRFVAAQSSKQLTIIDVFNQTKKSLSFNIPVNFFWQSDEQLVLLKNMLPGISWATLAPASTSVSEFIPVSGLSQKTIRSIVGFSDNYLYFIDEKGSFIIYLYNLN